MPPTIIAIAISRNASIPLLAGLIRNLGKMRLRTRAYRATKTGRLLTIVETKDTGPLSIADSDSIIPEKAKLSLKASRPIADFLCFMLLSCLKVRGCIETSRKIPDMQNVLSQSKFQAEI